MRILLMADYPVGLEVAQFLKEQNENIVGFVKHPSEFQKCTDEIIEVLQLPEEAIIQARSPSTAEEVERIKQLSPDIILVVFWGLILKSELIKIPSLGCINFHCSYLPYNRGKNPNVWPIIEGTPAGITLHYIDEGIDTGDIIAQKQIPIESIDTAGTLYQKLVSEFIDLFKDTWPKIRSGKAKRIKQEDSKATFHYARDFSRLNVIELEKKYTGREIIDLLRARTFYPYPSAYFIDENNKKVHARIQLEYAESDK